MHSKRTTRTTLALALGLALACGGGSSGDAASQYNPIGLGSTWSYAVTNPDGSGYSETATITQSSSTSFVKKFVYGNTVAYVLDTETLDADGMWFVRSDVYGGSNPSSVSYSPPALLFPSDLTPGHSVSSTSSVSSSNSPSTTGTLLHEFTVNGAESVTVPAGTFSALKVTTVATGTTASGIVTRSYNVTWRAQGVGLVKSVNSTSADLSNPTTLVLTAYTIR